MAMRVDNREILWSALLFVAICFGLYRTSVYDYLLFHSLVEIFSVLIGCGIFVIAFNVRGFLRNNYFLFIGVAYFFVAGLDLIHMFAYRGMGIFAGHDADLPTQLWIAARFFQSISLFIAPLFIDRKPSTSVLIGGYSTVFAILLASIFSWGIFPTCYMEGSGLTTFKIVGEYAVCLILSGALIFTLVRREAFDSSVLLLIIGSIIVTIFSELAFTLYINVYEFANFLGHFLKVVAFYLIYRALIEIGLRKPFQLLFRELADEKEALRRSEADYRNLVNNLNDIIFKTDADGTLIYLSRPVKDVLGYEPQELMNRHFTSLIHPEDAAQFSGGIRSGLDEEVYNNEFRICTKQGEYRWVRSSSRATTENDKIVGIQGIVTDITERVRSEQALKESEEKLRLFIEHAPTSLAMFDRGMRYLAVSNRWLLEYGLGDRRVLGKSHYEIFPEIPENWKTVHQRGLQGEVVRCEEDRFLRMDGNVQWLRWAVRPWYAADDAIGGIIIFTEDITDRKMAVEALQQSEEKFRSIFDNSPLGLVHVDAQGIVTACNDSFVRIIGTPREIMIGLNSIRDLKDVNLLAAIREALAGGTGHHEGEYTSPITNKTVHLKTDVAPIFDMDGSVTGAIGLIEDVEPRLRVERELRKSEEKYRRLHETMRDAFVSTDMTGRIHEANQAYQDMLGYSQEELRCLTYAELTPYKWHVMEDGIVRDQVLSRGYSNIYEKEYLKKDGTIFPVELRVFLMRNDGGAPASMWAIVRDITERKKVENEIRTLNQNLEKRVLERTAELEKAKDVIAVERQRLYDILETMPDMICLLTPDRRYAFTNRSFRERFGAHGGRHCFDVVFGKKESCDFCEAYTVLKTGRPHHWEVEVLDGSIIDVYNFPFADVDGSPLILEINRDVTEQRRILNDLIRSNKDLEHFAYIASHDLQEPLRTVTSALQMFEKKHKGEFDKQSDQLIDYAVDGAKRMKALVQDLLAYSRVNTHGQAFRAVDMKHILDQSIKNCSGLIKEKGTSITYDPMPTVLGDPTQLVQVLQNLLGNAVKFSHEQAGKVHVSAQQSGNEWSFSVQDNGIGIEEKYFEKIFVIFQQLSKKGPFHGTGIGLAIVKKIVERHGGRVWVESKIGRGSTFYFTIPN